MVVWIVSVAIALLMAYLFGSIPTGYLAGRLLKGIDIRDHGSRSIGATNVLRTLGKGPAALVLLIDLLKGVAAILFTRWFYGLDAIATHLPAPLSSATWLPWAITLAALMVILGHSCSVWINWTGGKSAATGLGVLLAMCWPVGLGAAAVFLLVLGLFRIVSLSSMSAAVAGMVLMIVLHQPLAFQLVAIAGGLYVIWRHRANIQRLLAGTEPRLGQKPASPNTTELN